MNPAARIVIVVVVVAAAAGAGLLWRQHQQSQTPPPPPVPQTARPLIQPPAPPAAQPPAQPKILHPVDDPGSTRRHSLPALDEADPLLKKELIDLVGRKGLLSFLLVDGFARRFVASVNNLATDNAAAELWPVNRTPGRILTAEHGGRTVIGPRNSDRYLAVVHFIDGVDSGRAVALYRRVYPLLQAAYEDLGFPGRYFNDRLIEVIDHLLATPRPPGPIRIKGVNPAGPSGLYVFEDPVLEASSAGQKILLRVGPENAAILEAKLRQVRALIAVRAPAAR